MYAHQDQQLIEKGEKNMLKSTDQSPMWYTCHKWNHSSSCGTKCVTVLV